MTRLLRFRLPILFLTIAIVAVACAVVRERVRYFMGQQLLVQELKAIDVRVGVKAAETDAFSSWLLSGKHFRVSTIELRHEAIDQTLVQVAKLNGLQLDEVTITGDGDEIVPRLGVNGVSALSKFDTLSSLDLLFAEISDGALSQLDRLPKLDWLSLPESTRDDHLSKMPVLGSLGYLSLSFAYVTDDSVEYLAKQPRLRRLVLEYTGVSNEGIAQLMEAMPDCIIIGNSGTKGDDLKLLVEQVEAIKAGHRRDIYFSSLHFHDADLKPISAVDGIEELSLSGTWVTGEALSYVSSPKALRTLNLERCPLAPEAFVQIKRFTELRELNLNGTALNSQTAAELLQHLPNLEKLELMNCPVDNAIIPIIISLPHLTDVLLDGTNVHLSEKAAEQLYDQKPDLLWVL